MAQTTVVEDALDATPAPPPRSRGILVCFKPGIASTQQALVRARNPGPWRRVLAPTRPGASPAGPAANPPPAAFPGDLFLWLPTGRTDESQTVRSLQRSSEVLFAEPNFLVQLQGGPTGDRLPDDFHFPDQWALRNTGQTGGKTGADIDAAGAWEQTRGDKAVVLAVIDSGIDFLHPDLRANLWVNPREIAGNGIDDDGNGYADDIYGYDFVSNDADPFDDLGHGTHVAGVIGARSDNERGVTGLAWEISLMAVKAFDEKGDGDIASVVAALDYARKAGARIINASWGLPARSRALREAIQLCLDSGVLVVAAAGNQKSESLLYPAAYAETVAVAATDASDQRAPFSNHGRGIDLAAPGDSILSTVPNNAYELQSGTSMAAPHVAGVAALILSRHPGFSRQDLASILKNTSDPLKTDRPIGYGRLNAGRALSVSTPLPILSLKVPERVAGNVQFEGTVSGEAVAGFAISIGTGSSPTEWTVISSGAGAASGPLGIAWDSGTVTDGPYTFQLSATNVVGGIARVYVGAEVRNVHLASPAHNDIVRAGTAIEIRGSVYGTGTTYEVEYAAGAFSPPQWSSLGVELVQGGLSNVVNNILARWSTDLLPPNDFYRVRLRATTPTGQVVEKLSHLVYLDAKLMPGFPVHVPVLTEFPTDEWRHIQAVDLDGDGRQELVLVDPGDDDSVETRLIVLDSAGKPVLSRPLGTGHPVVDIPVVGDVDGDGRMEIFVDVGSKGLLQAFRHDGTPAPGNWPVAMEATGLAKILADLDGDGRKELVTLSSETVDRPRGPVRQLSVFSWDGKRIHLWEIAACEKENDGPRQFPAVGNFDSDPGLELVVPGDCDQLLVYDPGSNPNPAWSIRGSGFFLGSPVVGDVDKDGMDDVVVAANSGGRTNLGGIYLFSGGRSLRPGWPVLVDQSFTANPALGDFDGDRFPEICAISWETRQIHVLGLDGFHLPGWPIGPIEESSVKTDPVLADLDGDAIPDVVVASPGHTLIAVLNSDPTRLGGIKAWNSAAAQIHLNPGFGHPQLPMESSSGAFAKAAAPVITDLDGDGRLDIVAASLMDRTYPPPGEPPVRKGRSSIYAWALGQPLDASQTPWRGFRGGPGHPGRFQRPEPPNIPPTLSDIPNQITRPGVGFLPIRLLDFVEDSDAEPGELRWSVSGAVNLEVTVTPGQVLIVRPLDPAWRGSERIEISTIDRKGARASDTVTFSVREDYQPPQPAEDAIELDEDSEVEFDPLANDRHPAGQPLRLSGVSRPEFGRMQITRDNRLRYIGAPDFHGEVRVRYTVSDAEGGFAEAGITVTIRPIPDSPIALEDRVILDEDSTVEIDPLSNDSDADGEPLRLVSVVSPAHGRLTSGPGTKFTYRPAANFFGSDEVRYIIEDTTGLRATGVVAMAVKPVNDPPTVRGGEFTVRRNDEVTINFASEDPDRDEPKYTVIKPPEHGELFNYPTYATYYPHKGYVGPDSFSYSVSDGTAESPPALIELTVTDENNPPQLQDRLWVTKPGKPLRILISALDKDDDPVTYALGSLPAHGRLEGSAPLLVYVPSPGFLGEDSFEVTASDATSSSRPALMSIVVTDKNTAPETEDSLVELKMNSPAPFSPVAMDPEGDLLVYKITQLPLHGTITGGGSNWVYTPSTNFTGSDRLVFKVSDAEFDSDPAYVTFSVVHPNHPPESRDQRLEVFMNETVIVPLDALDADGDALLCPILKGPSNGRVWGVGTSLRYRPNLGYFGGDTFTYKAWDGFAYGRTATVTLDIKSTPAPAAPKIESIQPTPEQTWVITVKSRPGRRYELQGSEDLVRWAGIAEAEAVAGSLRLVDPSPQPARFYRVQER